ncbi:cytochrome oxidase putative small subunit CydP [Fontimonas sp. SYSU GA230001]|uniref:cytochrome oxidase putative small subunit CydP n=1 Tax=Fontimonas sp. SYSU GA230001 TaxID=3142450 RepID=UPI0032B5D18D
MGRGLKRTGDWRHDLRRRIGVLLAIKLVALILIKTLFFSGDTRLQPTPDHLHERLALDRAAAIETAHD